MARQPAKLGTTSSETGQPAIRSGFDAMISHRSRAMEPRVYHGHHDVKIRKPQKSVSAARVFKLPKSDYRHRKKRRETSPEETMIDDLEDELNEIGEILSKNAKKTFDEALAAHMKSLMSVREEDEKLLVAVSDAVATLSTPLTAGLVEVDMIKSNRQISQTMKISDNIKRFKDIIRSEQVKLENYWKEWDHVQDEYLELGIEVFGPQSFGKDGTTIKDGFKRDMELIDAENASRVAKIEEEIENLGAQALQRMKKSEKEMDAVMKKEKAKLLASLLDDI